MNYCKTCTVYQNNICGIQGRQKAPNDYCSEWQGVKINCDRCGAQLLQPLFYKDKILCHECFSALGNCAGCQSSSFCAFNADKTMPKMIPKVIQQGNMRMQTQEPNPALIAKTCEAGCKCWNDEYKECYREYQWCQNHTEIPF